MRYRIVYLISGQAHLPYLVASLHTLRQHWDGPVYVYAWPESCKIAKKIAKDERLSIIAVEREPEYRGKNDQFLDKIKLVQSLQGQVDAALYIDADTTIHGDLSPLFHKATEWGFCATQFCDWTVQGRAPSRRVKDLLGLPSIDPDLIGQLFAYAYPSVNGGVWAAEPTSPVLPVWYDWTMEATLLADNKFIADEKVLHVMQVRFPNNMTVALGGAFNCSPRQKFQPSTLYDDQVIVRHYHGDSNCKLNKSQRGIDLWWPHYVECWQRNVGGIWDWRKDVKNKCLDPLECMRSMDK